MSFSRNPEHLVDKHYLEALENQYKYENDTFAVMWPRFYHVSAQQSDFIDRRAPEFLREKSKYMSILDDDFGWIIYSWYTWRFSPLYELLQKFILEIYQHGIYDYLERNELFNQLQMEIPEKEDPRRVLTVKMLSAGFVIWVCFVAASLIVFLFELIVKKLQI